MSNYLFYLLQVSGSFIILYTVFYLFFRKLTFHKANRICLLLILILSIALPLFPTTSSPVLLPEEVIEFTNFEYVDLLLANNDNASLDIKDSTVFNWMYLLTFIYWFGFLITLFRFISSIIKLLELKKNAAEYSVGKSQFFIANIPSAFSFSNWIFLPENKLENKATIIEHEKAHIRFKHTFDLMVVELYIMMCWFNPFVYLFRKSLRSIHEFQADEAVLKKQIKKSLYLSLLLNELCINNHSKIYSYFNHPIIESRVEMITKPSSKRKNGIRYLFLMPMLILLLTAFTKTEFDELIPNNEMSITQEKEPTFLFPIPNRSPKDISSPFGIKRRHPITKQVDIHGGIDIRAAERELVIASSDGTVSTATFKSRLCSLNMLANMMLI